MSEDFVKQEMKRIKEQAEIEINKTNIAIKVIDEFLSGKMDDVLKSIQGLTPEKQWELLRPGIMALIEFKIKEYLNEHDLDCSIFGVISDE